MSRHLLVGAVIFLASLASPQAAQPEPSATWEVIEQRPAEGEQCLVCRQQIYEGDIVEVRYKGRTFHVAAAMLDEFRADPDHYFYAMQGRGALFDEASMETPPMQTGWLMVGLYVLIGLVFGAASSYAALNRGLPALAWFFAGLFLNVLALVAVLMRKPEPTALPETPPSGLTKIPTTRAPLACPNCGTTNHPAASACSFCGWTLHPSVEPETARV